nr:unnamed protein product [Spirometra erinaceieuropaei]
MRIHEEGIDLSPDTPNTSSTPTMPGSAYTPPPSVDTSTNPTSFETGTSIADFSCQHCPRTFTSHIDLLVHSRIHRTETGKPVPGAPSYAHRIRLHCPHCARTFIHRMGLLGHMQIHEKLRLTTAG